MRISDWSSDVCSSDLGAISLSEINQYRTGFEDRLSRCGALPIDQHRIFADGVKREKRRGILLTAVHIDLDQIESEAEFPEHQHDLMRIWRPAAVTLHPIRSEESRVGTECVSKCRSRWSPSYDKNTKNKDTT